MSVSQRFESPKVKRAETCERQDELNVPVDVLNCQA